MMTDKQWRVFGQKLTAADGSHIAAAGLCGPGLETACTNKLDELRHLCFAGLDMIGIDLLLAERLKQLFPSGVSAVGATAYISCSRRFLPTGGVLGSPVRAAASSGTELEELESGLWMFSRPGGPGFVVQASKTAANTVAAALCKTTISADMQVGWLEKEFSGQRISCYLIICDGSGDGSAGAAIAVQGAQRLSFVL